jgi:transposase
MQVSVHAENRSQQLATFTHALRGSSTFMPTHAPRKSALSYILQALQAKHKQPNFINNKEAYTALISLLKPQTTKIIFINKKRRLTHQNQNIPLLKQFYSCIKE